MKKIAVLIALALVAMGVYAATDDSTIIYFQIVSSTAMSVAEQSPCDATTNFHCRWTSGTQTEINISKADGTTCQDDTNPAATITNDGTVTLDINMSINDSLPTGVETKYYIDSYDYGSAIEFNETTQTIKSSLAPAGTTDVWIWCDFDNFNGGVATTVTRKVYYNATES